MKTRQVRYVELEGERALHLGDAVRAGLIRPTFGAQVRFIDHENETCVHQGDLIDNEMVTRVEGE